MKNRKINRMFKTLQFFAGATLKEEEYILGSGKLYIMDLPADGALPADSVIEAEANWVGQIKGGAAINYTPTFYDVVSDETIIDTFITKEEVIMKSGIMTITQEIMARLSATGRVSTDSTSGVKTLKLGGLGNINHTKSVVHFVHEGANSTIRVTIVGKNIKGFGLNFLPEQESVLDAEFKALSQDTEGTLLKFTQTPKAIA